MKRIIALAGIAVIGSLFIMCPAEESPANPPLSVQVQGHVYDNQTKQPVADNFVGLYWQRQAESGIRTYEQVASTRTDTGGFYSLQGTVNSEACKVGTVKLFLMPISSDNGTGTRISCLESLQTIDLFRQ
jgi:hypothetical protein